MWPSYVTRLVTYSATQGRVTAGASTLRSTRHSSLLLATLCILNHVPSAFLSRELIVVIPLEP